MKYLSACGLLLACLLVFPASAQIPVPQKAETGSVPVPVTPNNQRLSAGVVPDFDADPARAGKKQGYTDAEGSEYYADGVLKLSPEAMAESEKLQEQNRQAELMANGFKWMPWKQSGQKIKDFIAERNLADLDAIDMRQGDFFDVAVEDVDHDGSPDVLVWDWGNCGKEGCLFTIYFGNKLRKPAYYSAKTIRPYERGVVVDNEGYYGL